MRELSDEILTCRQLIEAVADSHDVTVAAAALDRLANAAAPRAQLDAALALEAALRDLGRQRHRSSDARGRRDQLSRMANRWRGLADNLAANADALRIFGSFPEQGCAAGDIDLIAPPLDDETIERLAELSTAPAHDLRWKIPHAALERAGLATRALVDARVLARDTGLPADVFFGTNAFGEFVLGAHYDPAQDLWTVTDRWAPCMDFFDGQRPAGLDELRALASPAAANA